VNLHSQKRSQPFTFTVRGTSSPSVVGQKDPPVESSYKGAGGRQKWKDAEETPRAITPLVVSLKKTKGALPPVGEGELEATSGEKQSSTSKKWGRSTGTNFQASG